MSVTDPTEPVERPRPTGGVDWAKDDHAVAVVAPDGEQTLPVLDHPRRGRPAHHDQAAAGRRRGRGRDRTPRRPRRRRPARSRADRLRHPTRPAQEPARPLRLGRQQGRPVRRLRAGRRRAHRPAPAAPTAGRHTGHHRAAPDRARPQRPGRPPGRGGQPAARPPADLLPRRGRAVRRHRLRRSACGSSSASPPRTAPTGSPQALGGLAGLGGLQRPHPPRQPCTQRLTAAPAGATGPTPTPPPRSPPRSSPCCAPSPPRSRPWPPASPNNSTCTPTRRSSPACPAPGTRARRPAARRDRRRPRPVPHRRLPGLPGRRRPLHPPVRQGRSRLLPLGRGPTTPRRPLRLRRRQPPRQPLGRRPLPTRPRPRTRPPPRRARPGPRLGRHHLGLLDHPQPPTTPTNTAPCNASSTKINRRRLDTGQLIALPRCARSAQTCCARRCDIDSLAELADPAPRVDVEVFDDRLEDALRYKVIQGYR